MRDSIYSAMFGAMSNEIRMNQISNNLANVNTTGYKQSTMTFHDTFVRYAHDYLVDSKPFLRDKEMWPQGHVIAKPRLSDQHIEMQQGSLEETGNPLDLAITGDGFFQVETGDGQYLTRNGRFLVNAEGQLVTEQGFQVLGDGGPITVPPNQSIIIRPDGAVLADNVQVGQISLVTTDNIMNLERIGQNLYGFRGDNVQEIPAEGAEIQQGYLEKSNVNVVTEMVNMIETQRMFQSYTKVISSTDEIDQKLLTKVGAAT